MYHELKNFIVKAIILTGIIALAGIITFSTFLKEYYLSIFPYLLAFFFIIYIIVHLLLVYTSKWKKLKFETAYMVSFFIKFFGILIFVIVFLNNHKNNSIPFILAIFILYIIYTLFELKSIISYLKRTSNLYKKSK